MKKRCNCFITSSSAWLVYPLTMTCMDLSKNSRNSKAANCTELLWKYFILFSSDNTTTMMILTNMSNESFMEPMLCHTSKSHWLWLWHAIWSEVQEPVDLLPILVPVKGLQKAKEDGQRFHPCCPSGRPGWELLVLGYCQWPWSGPGQATAGMRNKQA